MINEIKARYVLDAVEFIIFTVMPFLDAKRDTSHNAPGRLYKGRIQGDGRVSLPYERVVNNARPSYRGCSCRTRKTSLARNNSMHTMGVLDFLRGNEKSSCKY